MWKLWATVESKKWLSEKFELNGEYGASGLVRVFLVVVDAVDFRIRKDGHVEVCGVFGFVVEPKAGGEATYSHGTSVLTKPPPRHRN